MVRMIYTRYLLGQIKKKIFGAPKEYDKNTEITKPKKKGRRIKLPKIRLKTSSITGIIMPIIMLLVGLTIFGNVSSAINTSVFSPAVSNLMGLVPLVLAGATIIGIVTMAFGFVN